MAPPPRSPRKASAFAEKMPGSQTLLLQLPAHDLDAVDRARARLERRDGATPSTAFRLLAKARAFWKQAWHRGC